MDGFVADYISAFTAEMGGQPSLRRVRADHDRLHAASRCRSPRRWPAASRPSTTGSARCRRRRSPTGRSSTRRTSSGFVVNMAPADSFPRAQRRRDDLRAARGQGPDLAGLLRPAQPHLADRHHPRVPAARAVRRPTSSPPTSSWRTRPPGSLPSYSFIEPNLLHGHNDMHPAFDALFPGPGRSTRRPSLLGRRGAAGQDLRRGPLLVLGQRVERLQHAAHGHLRRARRHLRPRPAAGRAAARPGRPGRADGLRGSTARACACRPSPISAWIPEQTVVNDEYRTRRSSGPSASAGRSARRSPPATRPPGTSPRSSPWTPPGPRRTGPTVSPRPVPVLTQPVVSHEARLRALPRHIVFGLLALGKTLGRGHPGDRQGRGHQRRRGPGDRQRPVRAPVPAPAAPKAAACPRQTPLPARSHHERFCPCRTVRPGSGSHRELFDGCANAWEALERLHDYLCSVLQPASAGGRGGCPPAGDVEIAEGARVEAGAYIRGPALIGPGTEVRHGQAFAGGGGSRGYRGP